LWKKIGLKNGWFKGTLNNLITSSNWMQNIASELNLGRKPDDNQVVFLSVWIDELIVNNKTK
jgi:hypothetical protein